MHSTSRLFTEIISKFSSHFPPIHCTNTCTITTFHEVPCIYPYLKSKAIHHLTKTAISLNIVTSYKGTSSLKYTDNF